ncbi:MAG: hypothetical protein QXF25_02290, partial [Candidatus Pacearchaeota archaeon]
KKECFGNVFNIGSGKNYSVNFVTNKIMEISKIQVNPIRSPALNEIKDSLSDITKAKTILGWSPKTSFEQGLKETYKYFVSQ